MHAKTAALYARVSSQQQRDDQTVDSQLAALRQYAADQGYLVGEEWIYVDEGYSGATLLRPGLERLRDLTAQGHPEVVLIHSPDRLARKYAYQVLLIEEIRRCGVEVIFLKSTRGDSPEDELLLQFQGMIAEYERAQIAERTRRGRIHRARAGHVSVLTGAPYGYRYVRKSDIAAAYYEITEPEAQVVRDIFRLYTREQLHLRSIAHHLTDRGAPTPTGKSRWNPATIWGILRNPAYKGMAAFGKTRRTERLTRLTRPGRQRGGGRRRRGAVEPRPREEWIELPVPAIVDETAFALAAELMERNKQFAPRNTKDPTLLQGLLVCRRCGYSCYRSSSRTSKRRIYYYRCRGSDNWRWENGRICTNPPVRQDYLDELVWNAVIELLADRSLVAQELERRLDEQRNSDPTQKQREQLQREVTRSQKAIERLVEAYQEELISLEELRLRMPELRRRMNAAGTQLRALDAQLIARESYMRLSETVEIFLSKLQQRAHTLSVEERQNILRLVVKEVHVDHDKIVIKHSIRPAEGGSGPGNRLRSGVADARGGSAVDAGDRRRRRCAVP